MWIDLDLCGLMSCIRGIGLKLSAFGWINSDSQKMGTLYFSWGMCQGRGYF